jgi:hypothetical protein
MPSRARDARGFFMHRPTENQEVCVTGSALFQTDMDTKRHSRVRSNTIRVIQRLPWLYLFLDVLMASRVIFFGSAVDLAPFRKGDFFSLAADATVRVLMASIAIGTLTMALIQVLKPPLRSLFHRHEIRRWIRNGGQFEPNVDQFLDHVGLNQADALLELPAEELIAQIQAAAEAITFSATRELGEQTNRFLDEVLGEVGDRPNIAQRYFGNESRELSGLSYLLQRRLDTLQVQIRYKWQAILSFLSLHVALALSLVAMTVFFSSYSSYQSPAISIIVIAIPLAVLSGFFASLARDLTAIVERLRR